MRRDIGGEVVVAISALAMLAFALVFAILLALSSNDQDLSTATPFGNRSVANLGETALVTGFPLSTNNGTLVPSKVLSRSQTITATSTDTDLPVQTATFAETAIPSDTPTASLTYTISPIATDTPLPSATASKTATLILSDTPTSTVSATPTLAPTKTATLLPTASLTKTATPTESATLTLAPTKTATALPTASLTKTATLVLSDTFTPIPTATATATHTVTVTPTLTSKPTNTSVPTVTPSVTLPASSTLTLPAPQSNMPTATSVLLPIPGGGRTATPDLTGEETAIPCTKPDGWDVYIVEPGATLFSIARAVNSTVAELRDVNCLNNEDLIGKGDELFVPILPVHPVQTSVPVLLSDERVISVVGCRDAGTIITDPRPLSRLHGIFTLHGTASASDFGYYKIEVRPDWAEMYSFYSDSETAIIDDILGEVNAEIFDDGLHWLRVSVVDPQGDKNDSAICDIPVFFD